MATKRHDLPNAGYLPEPIGGADAEAYLFQENDVWRLVCFYHIGDAPEGDARGTYAAMAALKFTVTVSATSSCVVIFDMNIETVTPAAAPPLAFVCSRNLV